MIEIDIRKQLHGVEGPFVLEVPIRLNEGEILALYGPSGVGKTTLLRMIAGLESPDAGRIEIDGESWYDHQKKVNLAARKRKTGMVFQDYALFPNMTVRQNIAFAQPRRKREPELVDTLLRMTDLAALENRKPRHLSGGQAQRVALARAIAARPRILLLDEALSALDPKMRQAMQSAVAKVHQKFGLTTIIVTHDLAEVFLLADKVAVLQNGKLQQLGPSFEIFGPNTKSENIRLIGKIVMLGPQEASILVQSRLITVRIPASHNYVAGQLAALDLQDATGEFKLSHL